MNYESIRIKFRNDIYIPLTKRIRKRKLKCYSFTIISNNCWGGTIYDSYGLIKQTPTIGMFMMPKDYLLFLSKLDYYLSQQLFFISPDESKWKKELSKKKNWGTYLIARIGDIELHMLHYHDKEIALNKWNRRVKRINKERLIVKFNDQNGCNLNDIKSFLELPYKNKLCFVSQKNLNYKGTIYIPPENKNGIYASKEPFGNNKKININNYINSLKIGENNEL